MSTLTTTKVRITWNGLGGALDSVAVKVDGRDEYVITDALIKLVRGNIVAAGDTFTVEELSS